MLSFFRRIVHSRVGAVITLGVLVLIGLAFAAGDIPALRMAGPTGGAQGNSVATVGTQTLSDTGLRDRIRFAIDGERQRNPGITTAQFLALGGFEAILDQSIDALAIRQFGSNNGIVIDKRVVDGEIASIPSFQDMSGKFDQKAYEAVLKQRQITDTQVRDDIRLDLYRQWLLTPLKGTGQAAQQLALPYASLLLERRQGSVAFLPGPSFGPGPAPTEAELTGFYNSHHALFTVPERRIVRYAVVSPDRIPVTPTEADIQAAWKDSGSRFAATEHRTIRQVTVFDQKGAEALAAKVRGGASLADAAKQAGLEPTAFTGVGQVDYARQNSTEIANAAFSAAKGAVVGPLRSRLGWVVLTVEAIDHIPGKTLEQARPQLVEELTKSKRVALLTQTQTALSTGLAAHSTFDELVGDRKLKAEQTPALLPNGIDPDDLNWKAPPTLAPVVRAGFAAAAGDDPQLVPLGQDGSFALVKLEKIVPPRLRPLTEARTDATREFLTERALKAAREAAVKLVAAVDGGKPLAAAVQAAAIRGAKVDPVDATRAQVTAAGPNVPPAITLLFSIPAGKARLIEAPQRAGYIVVWLEKITNGDASKQPEVVADARRGLGTVAGGELAEQFVKAMRRDVGVTRNATAIKQVRDNLANQGAGD